MPSNDYYTVKGSLQPTTVARTHRYDETSKYPRRHLQLTSKGIHRELPLGWAKYVHPEGKAYYHHADHHIVTETNIERRENLEAVALWRQRVCDLLDKRGIKLTSTTEIALELNNATTPPSCSYYLIDYAERCEFWLEDTSTESLGMDMAFSQDHLQLALLEHFWTHVEFFPMHRPMPERADDELVSTLTHAVTDQLTSEESTAPFTASECERFLGLLRNLKVNDGAKTCVVARLWRVIVHSQFINLHGHDGARLARTQSILQEENAGNPSRMLLWFSKLFLFNAPDAYLSTLRTLWVDRVVYAEHWQKFMDGMLKEWSNTSLMATLLVAVNVSFLGDADSHPRLASIASIIFGVSSLVSSILLTRRHRGASEFNAATAHDDRELILKKYTMRFSVYNPWQ